MPATDKKIDGLNPAGAANAPSGVSNAPQDGPTDPEENLFTPRIQLKSDVSYLARRASRILFVLVAFLLIYFLMPITDILNVIYSYDSIVQRQFLFAAAQKLFFLPLGLF